MKFMGIYDGEDPLDTKFHIFQNSLRVGFAGFGNHVPMTLYCTTKARWFQYLLPFLENHGCRLYNDVLQSTGYERQQAAIHNPAQKKIANRDGL